MPLSTQPIKKAYKILIWQLMLIIGLALIMLALKGTQSAWSTLLGGAAYWLPTLAFVWRVFANTTARAAKLFLIKFVTGEALKLLFSGILFYLIVQYLPVNVLSVLIGFIGAIIAFWIASMIFLAEDAGVAA